MKSELTPAPEPISDNAVEASSDGEEMNFLDHLEELRGTLIRCMLSLIAGIIVVMLFLKGFAGFLNWPLRYAMGEELSRGLVTTSPMAVFSVILQVSFLGGFALSLPLMLYFISRFVAPGLTKKEKSILKPGCVLAFGLFLVGCSFSYLILVPASLKASMYFNQMFDFHLFWSADRYYGLLVWMVLGIGLSFEFPLVLVLLVYVGILTPEKLSAFRPYSIVVFLALAAVLTPTTDPFTFLLLAVPMGILYEIALRISRRISVRGDG